MKRIFALIVFLSSFSVFAGKGDHDKSNKKDPVILEIGGVKVYLSEFKYIYNKNNSKLDDAYSESSIKEYLELFINFKLKVMEAEKLGLDTLTSFVNELNGYKKQLAKPYLTDQSTTDKFIKEAYERMKTEIHASHILLKLKPDASPKDSLKVFNEIIALKKRALNGEDFGELAAKYSEDPSAKTNSGDLGFFTSMRMVYKFESAAYNTKIGDISQPVRTRFGYHIIKVHEVRKASGKVKVAHIMVEAADDINDQDSIQAHSKIKMIYDKVASGENWEQICSQYSDHASTKNKGGEMAPFAVGQFRFKEFEDQSFALNNVGDISKPFKTAVGWHVVKLLDKEGIPSFDKVKDKIKNRVTRDSRAEINKKVLINRLKKEDHFKEYKKSLKLVYKQVNDKLAEGKWEYDYTKKMDKSLFTIEHQKYTTKDFLEFVKNNQKKRDSDPMYIMQKMYDSYQERKLLEYEQKHLHEKYEDYRMLIKEYRDGILLFQLMDENVWSKAVSDTTGLKEFHKLHEHNYVWHKRMTATIYDAINHVVVDSVKAMLVRNISDLEIERSLNRKNPLNIQIKTDTWEIGENAILDKISWKVGAYEVEDHDRVIYIVVDKVEKARDKTFLEAKGRIISDYQNYLEKQWIEELKNNYPIVKHQDVIDNLIKK